MTDLIEGLSDEVGAVLDLHYDGDVPSPTAEALRTGRAKILTVDDADDPELACEAAEVIPLAAA